MSDNKQAFQQIIESIKNMSASSFSNLLELEDAMFYSLMDLFQLFQSENIEPSEQKACLRLVLTTFYATIPPEQQFLLDNGAERCYTVLARKGRHMDAAMLDRIRQTIKTPKSKQSPVSFN